MRDYIFRIRKMPKNILDNSSDEGDQDEEEGFQINEDYAKK